ncbi:MAG TPA: DUF262 domain-containing HNH endonuclease family protein [Candidatus Acidoferrum sp.]|jgi:hypothetical protein
MFSPVPTRIEDILNAPAQFAIPVYQRDYKWGKDEASELVDDLNSYKGAEGENLFLGNFILEKSKGKKTFIVDGQQRLTTVLLLLIACRMRAKELGLSKLEPRIQEKITFMNSTTGESLGCRLIASESIRDLLEYMGDVSWSGDFPRTINKKTTKRKIKKVKPIYEEFSRAVSTFEPEELSKFLGALYNSFVAKIEVESEVEALSIFERTNARGLDLEISDLLKNFLFSKKVDSIKDMWDGIVENSDGTLLRMLKYFYVSKNEPVHKSNLYKKLKDYGERVGPEGLTAQLEAFSRFYRVVKHPGKTQVRDFFEDKGFQEISAHQYRYEQIARALEGLKEFGVILFCPVAYAAIECIERNNRKNDPGDAKKLIQLFETFERYHFINNTICELPNNDIETLYAETCIIFGKSSSFVKCADLLINQLKSKERLAPEAMFVDKFATDISYSPDQISLISYVLDRLNNFGLDPGQCLPIYNPDPKLRKRNHSIEHFFPQNPAETLDSEKAVMEFKDNIGNLFPVYFRDNQKLGNSTPAEKIRRLRGELSKNIQNQTSVKEFLEQYGDQAESWGTANIKKRAEDLAIRAYRQVWKIA